MFRRLLPIVLLTAAACSRGDLNGRIAGKVTWQSAPVSMALVEAYPKPDRDPTTPPLAEAPSAEDGRYQLELPPGRYWIWARATVAGDDRDRRLVGQAASNPIQVVGGETAGADLRLRDATGFAEGAGPAGTGVRGAVFDPEPQRVMVYAYPGSLERPLGPGFSAAVAPDADGAYQIDLAPGPYSIAARWRSTGADHGQLRLGDRVATIRVKVSAGTYTEAQPLRLHQVDPDVYRTVAPAAVPTETWIEGLVVDSSGNPKAGIRVLAFTDSRMAGKPLALSPPSSEDGSFRVYLNGAGRYFLGARSRIGGPAEPGEWNGAYRGEDGGGVRVDVGKPVIAVKIRVAEVW